jgi:MerR family transcriptional regulator, light-induced transcriptional regulator
MAEYKIKELEVLTGIKAHTLRIWEKRYGIIEPERTETKIRTYTDQELTLLLNVALLNKSGVKISHIAKMSQQEINERVFEIETSSGNSMAIDKFILALVEMDEPLFHRTLSEITKEFGLVTAFKDYLVPFLERIGVMWRVGSINPSQEHFMSVLIRQKIISEIDRLGIPEKNGKVIMLYLPEHEQHEISLLFYQYFLRSKGFYTVYLGQGVPYDALILSLERVKPDALLTSWLGTVDSNFMINYFKNLKKDSNNLPVFAGGAQIGAHKYELGDLICPFKDQDELSQLLEL